MDSRLVSKKIILRFSIRFLNYHISKGLKILFQLDFLT